MDKKPYYISTAIAYTSAKPHIGNTYEIVLADAIARYKRMTGYDVYFQTGTDEHGQKIQEKAEAAGITPQQHVDKVAGEVKTIWDLMNTTYDKFIRTTDPMHEKKVQKIFKKLYDQGDIYKGAYKGKYCKPCESFWTESQLKDGCCPDCGRPCVDAEEEAYFFRMSKYADRLMKHIEEHPEFIQPESRKNEMVNNFLKPGLQDLCVSRTSFSWGIPVDFEDVYKRQGPSRTAPSTFTICCTGEHFAPSTGMENRLPTTATATRTPAIVSLRIELFFIFNYSSEKIRQKDVYKRQSLSSVGRDSPR